MSLKVLELFAGVGACSKALERLEIDHEIVDAVEIDKYAIKSFNAIHNTNFEPQDICTWDKDIEVDLIMHGSPCQDFSLAGKQAGGDEGSGTRSSLMYETIRIVEKLKPKYVIWENVKNVISKKHIHNFNNYIERMNELGYTSYYQVLNAKDYGIPQNRERVFTVSILNNSDYSFPKKEELNITMHNFLEENVDEKYYLSENMTKYVTEKNEKSNFKVFRPHYAGEEKIAHTIQTSGGNRADDNFIIYNFPQKQELKLKLKDMLEDEVDEKYYLSDKMIKYISATGTANFKNPDAKINLDIARPLTTDPNKRAGTTNYICNDLPSNFNLEPINTMPTGVLTIKNNTKKGYLEATEGDGVDISGRMQWHRGKVQKQMIQTINTNQDYGVVTKDLRIRKLTPKECWRLMGFDDEDIDKASKVNSNTQLYKQAGNSIVVNVLEAILRNLLLEENNEIKGQLSIYDLN